MKWESNTNKTERKQAARISSIVQEESRETKQKSKRAAHKQQVML